MKSRMLFRFFGRLRGVYIAVASWFSNIFLLIVRGYWGYQFLQTGLGKLGHLENVTSFFASLGIPFPYANAVFVGSLETLGGGLFIVGLGSRYAALPLIGILAVAFATDDREALLGIFADPQPFFQATPFLFLFVALIVLSFGAGLLSLDGVIGWWRSRRAATSPK